MTYYELWSAFTAVVFGWIAWDTRPKYESSKVYCPNKALALYTQWQLKADSDLTWCRDGEEFETFCKAVDHYMDEELRGFPA